MPSPTDISVVIPVYNGAAVLPRALTSVFAQTVAPTEIIVVDDGSTDGSADVAQRFGERVRVMRQPNAGVSAARNRGVAECRAELVAFLDADDEWLPGFMETIRHIATAYPDCSIYSTGYIRRFSDGTDQPCVIRGLPGDPSSWTGILPNYFRIASMSDPPVWTSAAVVRRDLLLAVGGFPTGVTSGEDLLTWARLALRKPIAYASTPLARYWQPADALPSVIPRANRAPQTQDTVGRTLRALLPDAPAHQRGSLKGYIALWHKMRASYYFRLGRPFRAAQEICTAVSVAPLNGSLYMGILRSLFRRPGV